MNIYKQWPSTRSFILESLRKDAESEQLAPRTAKIDIAMGHTDLFPSTPYTPDASTILQRHLMSIVSKSLVGPNLYGIVLRMGCHQKGATGAEAQPHRRLRKNEGVNAPCRGQIKDPQAAIAQCSCQPAPIGGKRQIGGRNAAMKGAHH